MDIRENKEILIERMLDPGAMLTDAELRLIMEDQELREILEVSAAVRGAAAQPSSVDVEAEWRLFRHKLRARPSRWRWIMRVAAIFLGVLVVSAIVRVGIDRLMADDPPAVVVESKPTDGEEAQPAAGLVTEPESLLAEEAATPLRPEKKSVNKKKSVRPSVPVLTEEEEMEVDEYLQLQQSRIDNDVAMMRAELYVEELQALSDPALASTLTNSDGLSGSESRFVVMP